MQISPIQNSFKGILNVRCSETSDISKGYSQWEDEAGPACDIVDFGNYKIAKINSNCISKITPDEIVVKNHPHGYTSYFIKPDKNVLSFDTLLSAYNASCQNANVIIDTTI